MDVDERVWMPVLVTVGVAENLHAVTVLGESIDERSHRAAFPPEQRE